MLLLDCQTRLCNPEDCVMFPGVCWYAVSMIKIGAGYGSGAVCIVQEKGFI